jgi:hypothetical protein
MKPAVASIVLLLALPAVAETALDAGNWRLKVTSSTNGVAEPPDETTQCLESISPQGLATYFAPVLEGTDAQCETTEQPATAADTFNFRLTCEGAALALVADTAVTMPSSRAFTMKVHIDTRAQDQHAVVDADSTGEWVGPCPAPE